MRAAGGESEQRGWMRGKRGKGERNTGVIHLMERAASGWAGALQLEREREGGRETLCLLEQQQLPLLMC